MAPGANYMGGKRSAAKARSKDTTGRVHKNFFGRQRLDILSKSLSGRATSAECASGHGPRVSASDIGLSHAKHAISPVVEVYPSRSPPSRRTRSKSHKRSSSGSRSSRVLEALDTGEPLAMRAAMDKILSIPDLAGLSTRPAQKRSRPVDESERERKRQAWFQLRKSRSGFPELDQFESMEVDCNTTDDELEDAASRRIYLLDESLLAPPANTPPNVTYQNDNLVDVTHTPPSSSSRHLPRRAFNYPCVSLSSHSAQDTPTSKREPTTNADLSLRDNLYEYQDPWNAIGVILGLEVEDTEMQSELEDTRTRMWFQGDTAHQLEELDSHPQELPAETIDVSQAHLTTFSAGGFSAADDRDLSVHHLSLDVPSASHALDIPSAHALDAPPAHVNTDTTPNTPESGAVSKFATPALSRTAKTKLEPLATVYLYGSEDNNRSGLDDVNHEVQDESYDAEGESHVSPYRPPTQKSHPISPHKSDVVTPSRNPLISKPEPSLALSRATRIESHDSELDEICVSPERTDPATPLQKSSNVSSLLDSHDERDVSAYHVQSSPSTRFLRTPIEPSVNLRDSSAGISNEEDKPASTQFSRTKIVSSMTFSDFENKGVKSTPRIPPLRTIPQSSVALALHDGGELSSDPIPIPATHSNKSHITPRSVRAKITSYAAHRNSADENQMPASSEDDIRTPARLTLRTVQMLSSSPPPSRDVVTSPPPALPKFTKFPSPVDRKLSTTTHNNKIGVSPRIDYFKPRPPPAWSYPPHKPAASHFPGSAGRDGRKEYNVHPQVARETTAVQQLEGSGAVTAEDTEVEAPETRQSEKFFGDLCLFSDDIDASDSDD
ncbi:hypothetical protein C8R43DRAFT_1168728 [Mycena crocata]|nr:hypothetical protein C8R43DRAFT_1168728 [Mycena crocata]